MARPPVVDTEIARLLYERDGGKIEWLALKLGVSRQKVGDWVHSRSEVPRRRQAQIILFLEAHGIPLFDERGFALLTGGRRNPDAPDLEPQGARTPRPNPLSGRSRYVSPLDRRR